MREWNRFQAGVKFENDGLRARGKLLRGRGEDAVHGESQVETGPGQNPIDTASYYPHPVGATWTWEERHILAGETSRVTETVVDREGSGSAARILVEGSWTTNGEETAYTTWRSDNQGLREHRSRSDDLDENTFDPPLPLLPAQMVRGKPYTFEHEESFMLASDDQPFNAQNEVELVLEEIESIEVAGERFDDCLKVRQQSVAVHNDGTVAYSRATTWYAPGVGPVSYRWESQWGRGEGHLVSFDIPD